MAHVDDQDCVILAEPVKQERPPGFAPVAFILWVIEGFKYVILITRPFFRRALNKPQGYVPRLPESCPPTNQADDSFENTKTNPTRYSPSETHPRNALTGLWEISSKFGRIVIGKQTTKIATRAHLAQFFPLPSW